MGFIQRKNEVLYNLINYVVFFIILINDLFSDIFLYSYYTVTFLQSQL